MYAPSALVCAPSQRFFDTFSVTQMFPSILKFFLIDPQLTVFTEAITSFFELSASYSVLNPVGVRSVFLAVRHRLLSLEEVRQQLSVQSQFFNETSERVAKLKQELLVALIRCFCIFAFKYRFETEITYQKNR